MEERGGEASGSSTQCLTLIVLGAAGDLARKKTYPALHKLYEKVRVQLQLRARGGEGANGMTCGDCRCPSRHLFRLLNCQVPPRLRSSNACLARGAPGAHAYLSAVKHDPLVCTGDDGRTPPPPCAATRMEADAFPPARREPAETACAT